MLPAPIPSKRLFASITPALSVLMARERIQGDGAGEGGRVRLLREVLHAGRRQCGSCSGPRQQRDADVTKLANRHILLHLLFDEDQLLFQDRLRNLPPTCNRRGLNKCGIYLRMKSVAKQVSRFRVIPRQAQISPGQRPSSFGTLPAQPRRF